MKKFQWVAIIGILVILTTIMGLLGYYVNWWIFGGWGIAVAVFLLGLFIYLIITRTKRKEPEKREIGTKIAKISKEECVQNLRETLFKPEYADMIKEYKHEIRNYGTEERTPICTIRAKGEHEPFLIYFFITNMAKPEMDTIMEYNINESWEEFKIELETNKNMIADIPEKIRKIKQIPMTTPMGQQVMRTEIEEISREEARKREKEEKEEEVEAL